MSDLVQALINILLFFTGWTGLWVAIAWPLFQKFEWRPFRPTPANQKILLLLPLYGIAPFIVWGTNKILGQSWGALGALPSAATGRSLALGFGVAVGGLTLLLLLKYFTGLITFDRGSEKGEAPPAIAPTALAILGLLVLSFVIGGVEELVFRGWLQTQLESAVAPWLAAMLGSLLFAIAHLVWDGREGLWQQPGLWLLGAVLVIARWTDGDSLALAWGLHAGWVWALACVGEFLPPQPAPGKPRWLTGRLAQPLTDLLDLALLGATAGLIWQCLQRSP